VYWTLAVGLGGLSLVTVTTDSAPCRGSLLEAAAGDDQFAGDFPENEDEAATKANTFQSITVKLGDALELTDLPGGAVTVDLVSDTDGPSPGEVDDADRRGSGRRSRTDRGPGETAF
jgi:hypothetical protein